VTRQQTLEQARQLLSSANIDDATIEAEILLMHALNIQRTQLYCEPWEELTPGQSADFWQTIERRIKNEPSAYITGHREFYGLDFIVNFSVLIPRPETELLVEKVIEQTVGFRKPVIVDVGTGSGVIAVSVAVHVTGARIYATDISPAALQVARENACNHNVADKIQFLRGDLLSPVPAKADIIVANLPYVTLKDLASVNTVGYEPSLALNGGEDGLDIIRRLCSQVKDKLNPDGCVLLEIGVGQADAVVQLLRELFPLADIEILPDFSGIDRVVRMTLAN